MPRKCRAEVWAISHQCAVAGGRIGEQVINSWVVTRVVAVDSAQVQTPDSSLSRGGSRSRLGFGDGGPDPCPPRRHYSDREPGAGWHARVALPLAIGVQWRVGNGSG